MPVLFLQALQPGMILKTGIRNFYGQLLLPAGTTLEEKHLWILKSWGIREAEVQASSQSQLPDAATRSRDIRMDQARQEVLPLFKELDLSHPAVSELLKSIALFRANQKA